LLGSGALGGGMEVIYFDRQYYYTYNIKMSFERQGLLLVKTPEEAVLDAEFFKGARK
jgi:hypothetical protein